MPQDKAKRKIDMGVSDFYDGKSVFITGATGLVGSVMLEILLRCCPGVGSIYILLRPKKEENSRSRLESLLNRKIYKHMREKRPMDLNKVKMVEGDVAFPYLGLNEGDLKRITEEVSIVFHCAANITFNKTLRYIFTQNVLGTQHVLDVCNKMKKLEVFVYTSTYASNCYLEKLEEKVYPLPFKAERVIEALRDKDEEVLNGLVSKTASKWPNTYTFSKCVAENLVLEYSSKVPAAIIRPALISSCWKGPLPGYVEGRPGLIALVNVIAKGFVRVVPFTSGTIFNFVPVDVVANTHIVSAWALATSRFPNFLVVNCLSHDKDLNAKVFMEISMRFFKRHPLPNAILEPSITLCGNALSFRAYSIVEHYVPAVVADALMLLTGKKPKMFSSYRTYDRTIKLLDYFLTHSWICCTENFKNLEKSMQDNEKEVFYLNLEDFDLQEYYELHPQGATDYDWSIDKRSKEERASIIQKRTLFFTFVKVAFLMILGLLSCTALWNFLQVLQ